MRPAGFFVSFCFIIPASLLNILIPLWAWPDASPSSPPFWQNVNEAISNSTGVTWHVIINPKNGPDALGNAPKDQLYTDAVAKLNTHQNVITYGYILTNKAKAPRDTLTLVNSDVDVYASWKTHPGADISVKGIFFDEVVTKFECPSDTDPRITHYLDLAKYARSKPGITHVVFNPGDLGPETLFGSCDYMIEFEKFVGDWKDKTTLQSFPPANLAKSAAWIKNTEATTDVAGWVTSMKSAGLGAVWFDYPIDASGKSWGEYKNFEAANLKKLYTAIGSK